MVVKNMLNMQLMIFLLVIIGFCIRKKGIVGTEGRKNMVDLCLFVTLPFNIIHSFLWNGIGDDGFLRDRIVPVNWI